jgi:hypothetical protein
MGPQRGWRTSNDQKWSTRERQRMKRERSDSRRAAVKRVDHLFSSRSQT